MADMTPDPKPAQPAFDGKPPTLRQQLAAAGPWPVVALVGIGAGAFTAIAIWAPEGTREALFGVHGLLMTLAAVWLPTPGK